ncbi:unnamed protein product [Urochloa decumbens]|uniref:RING-type domain-containing protein n=1 Tax=Urochloa decumbens TaxID=240449 RepID=A0ABC9BCK9_9POAL
MADATMERSLAAAIESSVATAAGTLIWLVPPPQYHQHHHPFQEHEPAAQLPADDEAGGDDVVASLLDEFIPRDSDLDERILECPMTHQALLLAAASLQQEDIVVDMQIIVQQLELQAGGEAYRDGGFGAVPAGAAAVASLGKRTFHFHDAGAGDGGSPEHRSCCSICLDDFEDGEGISMMPCAGGHEFHTSCVAEWLGRYSNMCPLCRHALPTGVVNR